MHKRTAFIGHRDFLPQDIEERLRKAVKNEIDLGCKYFTMGTHGKFDINALHVCRILRENYIDIEIEVVITSIHQLEPKKIKDKFGEYIYKEYEDVKTIMYDIEEQHYKRKIIESNRQMIDACDALICYIRPNEYKSGAKMAMNYAKRKGLKIINLYKKEDELF